MPLRALLGEGDDEILKQCFSTLFVPQVNLAGVRDLDEPEKEYIHQLAMSIVTVEQLEDGSGSLVEWIKSQGFHNVYIHVDLDVMDPEQFPVIMCPTLNGLGFKQLLNILEEVQRNFQVVGYRVCPQG